MESWTIAKWVIAAGWAWFVAAAVAISNGWPGENVSLLLFFFGVAVGFVWLFMCIVFSDSDIIRRRWRLLSWLSVPAMPVVALGLYLTGWPMAVRVWLSEGELRAHAERVLAEPAPKHPLDQPEAQVGSFRVSASTKWNGVVAMQTWGAKGHGGGGLYYAPNGAPHDPHYPTRGRHLYGPWYQWGDVWGV